MTEYIPGSPDPSNQALAQDAETEFRAVLDRDRGDTSALFSLASLAFQEAQGSSNSQTKQAKLDVAADWYRQLVQVDPQNKEAFYNLGVIAWQKFYPAYQTARASLGMKPQDSGPLRDDNIRQDLRVRFASVVEDGHAELAASARHRSEVRRRHGVHEPAHS